MRMGRVETPLVNSPARRGMQRFSEVRLLARLGGRTPGARAVEIGCGSGYGSKLILDQFGAARVDAVDLDPAMVRRAKRRLARYSGRVRLAWGSATARRTALGADDGAYSAAFDFATIHHIPDWPAALAEVARVLAPGGRFCLVEVTATALARPTYRWLSDHPTEDRFTAGELLAELPRHGLHVGERWVTRFGGDYLFAVARRAEPTAPDASLERDAKASAQ